MKADISTGLDCLMAAGVKTLRTMGIPVSDKIQAHVNINTRAKRRLGCCIKRDGHYTIEISSDLIDEPSRSKLLTETILHELLHTCPDCANHGVQWKYYAGKVSNALGINISRTVDEEQLQAPRGFTYILKCKSCGCEIGRYRMSRAIQSPSIYRCGKCGGKLLRIK